MRILESKCRTLILHLVIVEFVRAVFLENKKIEPPPQHSSKDSRLEAPPWFLCTKQPWLEPTDLCPSSWSFCFGPQNVQMCLLQTSRSRSEKHFWWVSESNQNSNRNSHLFMIHTNFVGPSFFLIDLTAQKISWNIPTWYIWSFALKPQSFDTPQTLMSGFQTLRSEEKKCQGLFSCGRWTSPKKVS